MSMEMAMQQEPNPKGIMPLPYEAEIGDRLSDDGDCWVINCEQGSVAEMQCPADVEEATARFIVRAVNSHDALVAALGYVAEVIPPADYRGRDDSDQVQITVTVGWMREVAEALSAAQEQS